MRLHLSQLSFIEVCPFEVVAAQCKYAILVYDPVCDEFLAQFGDEDLVETNAIVNSSHE
jgi:hypothetical protein